MESYSNAALVTLHQVFDDQTRINMGYWHSQQNDIGFLSRADLACHECMAQPLAELVDISDSSGSYLIPTVEMRANSIRTKYFNRPRVLQCVVMIWLRLN